MALGLTDARRRFREDLAWMQANLINIHIPRGKPKVKPDQLLPPAKQPMEAAPVVDLPPLGPNATPAEQVAHMKARVRASMSSREADEFWRSAEGRRIKSLLGEDLEEAPDPEE